MKPVKVHIKTDCIEDRLVIKVSEDTTIERFQKALLTTYDKWHFPKVLEFEILNLRDKSIKSLLHLREVYVKESIESKQRKVMRKALKKCLKKAIKSKIDRLSFIGHYNWTFGEPNMSVSLDDEGKVFTYTGENGKLRTIRTTNCFYKGLNYFEIEIQSLEYSDFMIILMGIDSASKLNLQLRLLADQLYELSKDSIYISERKIKGMNGVSLPIRKVKEGDKVGFLLNCDENYCELNINGDHICQFKIESLVFPAISTGVKNSKFKIIIPDELGIQKRDFLRDHEEQLLRNIEEREIELEDWKSKLTDDHEKKLWEYSNANNTVVWDPKHTLSTYFGIKYPTPTTFVHVNPKPKSRQVRSLNHFDSGIHFVEINTVFTNKFDVGIINEMSICSYKNCGKVGMIEFEPYYPGDRIGIFFDMDDQIVEFFRNGINQGLAYKNINGPVSLYCSIEDSGTTGTILESDLGTYFDYKSSSINISNNWEPNCCDGFDMISNTVIDARSDSQLLRARAREIYRTGRRYFEVTAKDLIGRVKIGLAGRVGTCVDKFDFYEKVDKVVLGVLVDFDERTIHYYKDRKWVKKTDKYNIGHRSLSGYLELCSILEESEYSGISELLDDSRDDYPDHTELEFSGSFEINTECEKEMAEDLIIYTS